MPRSLRSRAYHRHMYIDLVHAYLREYGSQSKLAKAMGISEAYLSYVLTPVTGRGGHWQAALHLPAYQLADDLRLSKVPSARRAEQLVDLLCTDRDRREVLLYHISMAAGPRQSHQPVGSLLLGHDEIDHAMTSIGRTHAVALHGTHEQNTREAYRLVRQAAEEVVQQIDQNRFAGPYAQALMFLHDAASVLDRQDLALGYARTAGMVIDLHAGRGELMDRLHINVLLAEAVSLNNLGLWREALTVTGRALTHPAIGNEPDQWERSLLEQQLTAFASLPRFSIYQAEKIADRACCLVANDLVLQAGVRTRLVNTYLAQATPRAVRMAGRVLGFLHDAMASSNITPLRKVQVLRTMITHARQVGDHSAELDYRVTAQHVIEAAGLSHQGRLV